MVHRCIITQIIIDLLFRAASTAAIWLSKDEDNTAAYMSDIDNMHKIVLGADDAAALQRVASALSADGIVHKLWVEQPEGIVTALASAPYPRSKLQPYFKDFKLLR